MAVLSFTPVGEPDPRTPGVVELGFSNVRFPARPVPVPAKINAPGMPPGPGVRRVRIEGRVLVLALRAGELVVEAQPERQRQLVVDLELVVDPRRRVRLVERRDRRGIVWLDAAPGPAGTTRTDRRSGRGCCRWRRSRRCPRRLKLNCAAVARHCPAVGTGTGGPRYSKPILMVCRPLTHVRSSENCQRLFTW